MDYKSELIKYLKKFILFIISKKKKIFCRKFLEKNENIIFNTKN